MPTKEELIESKKLYETSFTNPRTNKIYQFNVCIIIAHINYEESTDPKEKKNYEIVSQYMNFLKQKHPNSHKKLSEELFGFKAELLKMSLQEDLDYFSKNQHISDEEISQLTSVAKNRGLTFNRTISTNQKEKNKQSCKCVIS